MSVHPTCLCWIWIRRSSSSWRPSRGSTYGKKTLGRSKEEIQDVFKWGVWPMWAFWNQAAILRELASMALFLLVFLVIVKLFSWVCLLNLLVCLVLPLPLAPSILSLPLPEPGFVFVCSVAPQSVSFWYFLFLVVLLLVQDPHLPAPRFQKKTGCPSYCEPGYW